MVPVNIRTPPPYGRTTHQVKGPGFFMIKCVRKIRILLLKVEECPDFSILQSNYPYVAPMEELASTLKVWIFPNFCHFPWIFASRQRNAPGFSGIFAYIQIFSSIGGVRILTGTTHTDDVIPCIVHSCSLFSI